MHEDPETNQIFRDHYEIGREIFYFTNENDEEAFNHEFMSMCDIFIKRIELYEEYGDYDMEEIEI